MDNDKTTKILLSDEQKLSIKQFFGIDADTDLFSPTIDYVFKRIFTADEKRSKIALIEFLNSVLEYESKQSIVDLTVVNPQIPVDSNISKKPIFDIRATFNDGKQAIIEMQVKGEHGFKKRSQLIISKSYSSQPLSGKSYNNLKNCYLICITSFLLFEDSNEFISEYRMRDKKGIDLTDDLTIIFLELPKIDGILNKNINEMTNLEMWAIFFKYVPDKSKRDILNNILNRMEGIKMATKILDEISKSPEERIQYEQALIAELDWISGIEGAKTEGKAEGRIEGKVEEKKQVAKNALNEGFSIEIIKKLTGLEIEDIQKLQDELGSE